MTAPTSANSELARLAAVSRQLGAARDYVQGGGGNTSVKLSARSMWIKASGTELAKADPASSFVEVDFIAIREGIGACRTESDYAALLKAATLESAQAGDGRRPSIETGFHALQGTCVLHSHSVWTNLLTCALEGQGIAAALFPEAIWVPYATPGLPICHAIAERIDLAAPRATLLLGNHGLIVAAPDPEAAWAMHDAINRRVKAHFGLDEAYAEPDRHYEATTDKLLFPDQAVFLSSETLRETPGGRAIQSAYDFLRMTSEQLGLTASFLPEEEAHVLVNMEAEKHRQKVSTQ